MEPEKLADLTVFSQYLMGVPEERIPGTEVMYTIVGCKLRCQKDRFGN